MKPLVGLACVGIAVAVLIAGFLAWHSWGDPPPSRAATLAPPPSNVRSAGPTPDTRTLAPRAFADAVGTGTTRPSGHSAIAGRVEIDGTPPGKRVLVSIEDAVAEAPGARAGASIATATSDEAGAFEIGGLEEGSDWRFRSPLGFRVAQVIRRDKRLLVVAAPTTEVVVSLTRVPVIRGRLVSGEKRAPVAGAKCDVVWNAWSESRHQRVESGPDGRFEASQPDLDPSVRYTDVAIEAATPDGLQDEPVFITPPPTRDHDAGDIELPEGMTVAVVVHDPGGAPIVGALVAGLETSSARRTDSKGRASVIIADEPGLSIRVTALGFECVEVPIPEENAKPIDVTLRREAILDVRVVSRAPSSLGAIHVSLSADVRDAWDEGNRSLRELAGGSKSLGGAISDDGRRCSSFAPDGEGRVVVMGVKAGTSILVEALDDLHDEVVLASSTVTASAGEWKVVELDVTKTEKLLRGRVRDSRGFPVSGARAIVGPDVTAFGSRPGATAFGSRPGVTEKPPEVETLTDATGRFELTGIFASPVALAVDKLGYAPLVRKSIELGSEDVELELTLDQGLTLELAILDADGAPIRGLRVGAETEGQPDSLAREREPGVYAVADVPKQAAVTVRALWARRQWTWSIVVTGDQTERVTMPAMGKVVIEYPPVAKFDLMTLDLEPAGDQPHVRERFHPPPADSGERFEFTVAPIIPGDYAVSLRSSSETDPGQGLRGRVTVSPGETTRVTLVPR